MRSNSLILVSGRSYIGPPSDQYGSYDPPVYGSEECRIFAEQKIYY